ncbi:MAG: hypothetical protein WCT50_03660 [Patescibacteria group bacterium]|jgi:hypothetical protein
MPIEKTYYWPTWLFDSFNSSLKDETQKCLFGQAQTHLWRALNIYDDFLDNEGEPKELSSANYHFRSFLKIIYTAKLPKYFYLWAENKLLILEKANKLEVSTRITLINEGIITIPKSLPHFNNLTKLSEKSLALAIAPVALLIKNGIIKENKELKIINDFFKYGLAAKQLSDDASDWLEDLKNNTITAVNVLILKEAKNKKIKLNINRRPEILYLLFIEAVAGKTCYNILNLCAKAKKEAAKLGLENQAPIILKLIKPLETAAQKALNFKKML